MYKFTSFVITAGLFVMASSAHAIVIDFKWLADVSLGEGGYSTLMFEADGTHTTSSSSAFLEITGTNGSPSYAYLDAGNAGLGVCGALTSGKQCNPSSDDNVSYHSGTPETLHFDFDATVVIDRIWLNNNHDGDRSLLNDFVAVGIDGSTGPIQLTNGGYLIDSVLDLGLRLNAGSVFDVGFYADQLCGNGGPSIETITTINFNNCEFYISKIEYSTVPEPTTLALLGLGLFGLSAVRRRQK